MVSGFDEFKSMLETAKEIQIVTNRGVAVIYGPPEYEITSKDDFIVINRVEKRRNMTYLYPKSAIDHVLIIPK